MKEQSTERDWESSPTWADLEVFARHLKYPTHLEA